MLSQFFALGLTALGAAASVPQARQDPSVGDAPGFSLRVELLTSHDLPSPVSGTYLSLIESDLEHILLTSSARAAHGLVFFTNGTNPRTQTTFWAAAGPHSAGLGITPEPPGRSDRAYLSPGREGREGIHTTAHSDGPPLLVIEDWGWFFCPREVNGQKANLLEAVRGPLIAPSDCVPVELQPICEPLPISAEDVVDAHYVQCLVSKKKIEILIRRMLNDVLTHNYPNREIELSYKTKTGWSGTPVFHCEDGWLAGD